MRALSQAYFWKLTMQFKFAFTAVPIMNDLIGSFSWCECSAA